MVSDENPSGLKSVNRAVGGKAGSVCSAFVLAAVGIFVINPVAALSQENVGQRPVVAVFDIGVDGMTLPENVLTRLSGYLASRLTAGGMYQAAPGSALREAMIDLKIESQKDCYDQECRIKLGQASAANKNLNSLIWKFGGECSVTLDLYDLRTEAMEKSVEIPGLDCSESSLKSAISEAAARLGAGDGANGGAGPWWSGQGKGQSVQGGSRSGSSTEQGRTASGQNRIEGSGAWSDGSGAGRGSSERLSGASGRLPAESGRSGDFSGGAGNGTSRSGNGKIEGVGDGAVRTTASREPEVRREIKTTADGRTGIEWVSVPGGRCMMGSELGQSDEKPVHVVTVGTFEIARTEVTVGQYRKCVAAGACSEPGDGNNCTWGMAGSDDMPVNCVTWKQAAGYARWAGGRLPRESEWEFAARDGVCVDESFAVDSIAWYNRNSGGKVHPVATRNANVSGLFDMLGNVSEWCSDWYHDSYDDAKPDGSEPPQRNSTRRVYRGGSYRGGPLDVRPSHRNAYTSSNSSFSLGFRPVRDVR